MPGSMGSIEASNGLGLNGAAIKANVGRPLRFLLTGFKLFTADILALVGGYAGLLAVWPPSGEGHGQLIIALGAAYVPIAFVGGGYAPEIASDAARSVQRSW